MDQLLTSYPFVFDELDSGFSYNRIIVDDKGNPVDYEILFCNKKFADFMGIKKDKLMGKRFSQINTQREDDFDWLSFYGKIALQKEKNTVERYNRSDKCFYKIKAVSPEKNFFIVHVSDITDFKKSTSMLNEIRHRYETIFSNTEDPHAVLVNEKFQDCNDASLSMMCTENRDYIIGKYPWDVSPEFQPDGVKSEKKARQHIHRARANGSTHFEWHHRNAAGVVFPAEIHLTSVTLGVEEMIYVTWRDMTNLKEAEIKRAETEERFRKFTEFNPAAIMIYQNDVFVYANPAAEKISGYSLEELRGRKFWSFVHPDHINLIKNRGRARQHGKTPQRHYEFKIISKEGLEKWVDFRAENITLSGENAVLLSAVDISHRKKIEEDLRRSREHLDITLDSIGDAVISTNKNGIIT
ncbi:MAG: PAS domain S-box protein, partial [bacterium]